MAPHWQFDRNEVIRSPLAVQSIGLISQNDCDIAAQVSLKKIDGGFDGHVQNVGDRLVAIGDFQGFAVEGVFDRHKVGNSQLVGCLLQAPFGLGVERTTTIGM